MPRINWNAIEREEAEIEDQAARGEITSAQASKQIAELHRDAREDFQEQQQEERRDEFGW